MATILHTPYYHHYLTVLSHLIKRANTLLPNNDRRSLQHVGVFTASELLWIRHGVVLPLHSNLTNFGGSDYEDRLGQAGHEAGGEDVGLCEVAFGVKTPAGGEGVSETYFVLFEGHEAHGHLGDDAGVDGCEALVEGEETLAVYYAHGGGERADGLSGRRVVGV